MQNIPKLKRGRMVVGPDWLGCCNTGTAPALYHSAEGKWVVGPEAYVCDIATMVRRQGITRRKLVWDGKMFWVFKTRRPAVDKFLTLCEEATVRNQRIREERRALQRQARVGDVGAALKLGLD